MTDRVDDIARADSKSRSRSRGRADFTRGSISPATRANRSSSRASFLGRPRQRTFQIHEDDEGAANGPSGAQDAASRWRSESRTVRGSLDTQDDEFVFSDEETDLNKTGTPRGRRLSAREAKAAKKTSPMSRQNASSENTARSDNTQREDKYPPGPKGDSQSPQSGKDVESQEKASPRPNILNRIPYPIAHFLGHRTKQTENRALLRPLEKVPRQIETLLWAFVGAMLGLGFVMITFSRWPKFAMSSNDPLTEWTTPIIIGSFGASSVILYGTPASPLGQPKAFVGGQFVSALVSVCITKLFRLNHDYQPSLIDSSHSLVWIAGGIAAAAALCAMILTDTLHPPGGATALLGATSPPVIRLGWNYLPIILLSSVIMEVWAMLWMNLGRARYPTFWLWQPEQTPPMVQRMANPIRAMKKKSK